MEEEEEEEKGREEEVVVPILHGKERADKACARPAAGCPCAPANCHDGEA